VQVNTVRKKFAVVGAFQATLPGPGGSLLRGPSSVERARDAERVTSPAGSSCKGSRGANPKSFGRPANQCRAVEPVEFQAHTAL
jgi:hypothetical protein